MGKTKSACLVATLLIAAGAYDAPAAEIPSGLAPPVAECISANAANIEQAVSSLPEATQFLVESVCAAPIYAQREAEFRASSLRTADKYKKLCDVQKQNHQPLERVDDYPDYCGMAQSYEDNDTGWAIFAANPKAAPAEATTYAAKLLLELRLSHMRKANQR